MSDNYSDEELLKAVGEKLHEKDSTFEKLKESYSELEMAHKRIYESEKSKSHFLSNLRNELNNPMAAILALSQEMVDIDLKDIEKYKKVAHLMSNEALNLDFQLRNLLCAAELESGDVQMEIVKVNVNTLVDDAFRNLVYMVENKSIKISKDIEDELWVHSDPDKLAIVISNLISNGVVFNEEGGTLEVKATLERDELVLTVKDVGIGISDANKEKIFDRFFQLDQGSTKKFMGLGLGLSIVKAICDLLDGAVTVKSKPGSGSEFTFKMPANLDKKADNICVDGVELFGAAGEEREF
ncbi:MAG: HAMP domain-containing histidine kinase [Deltaproteobacteria bacterium]|nr:HAMP domain-containing histidine kinase [Deltaproteobacteria bacterium]